MKTAFVFPGQGSQKPGMGKDFFGSYAAARKIFDRADSILGFSLAKTIFEGTGEELKKTSIAQVAILTVETAIFRVLEEKGFLPQACAGHSLGEYSALVAAGSLDFGAALGIVRKRALFMEEAALKVPSGMTALIGLEHSAVEDVLKQVSHKGIIDVANYNCPGQIVISGELGALEEASKLAGEKGARMCVPLQVSGGFHSRLMDEASGRLAAELEPVSIKAPGVSFLSNYSGDFEKDPAKIKELLVRQVNNPVRWTDIMQRMLDDGIERVVEVGPGKVLSGLWRRFDRTKQVLNVEDIESLEKLVMV